MGLFEHFPYSNFHDLNLNWIISKIKNIEVITADVAEQSAAAVESAASAAESAESAAESAESAARSSHEAAETVEPFTSTITEIRARMDAFVQQHSGPSDETLLYNSDTPVFSGTVTLSDSLSNYQNIKFVWRHRNDICEQEFKRTGSDGQNCWLRDTLGAAGTGGGSSIWEMCQMVAILGTGISLQLSNATVIDNSGYNDGPVDNTMNTGILQVIGIRNVADTEVVDARVSSDGTIHNTLEDRLNSDYENLITEIQAGYGIRSDIAASLLACFRNVAWKGPDGADYYNALKNALAGRLLSISAVFDPGDNIIYTTDSLDSLRQYLTVTAYYDDETSAVINSYTLSGELLKGTNIITVSYGTMSTTVSVTAQWRLALDTVAVGNQSFTGGGDEAIFTELGYTSATNNNRAIVGPLYQRLPAGTYDISVSSSYYFGVNVFADSEALPRFNTVNWAVTSGTYKTYWTGTAHRALQSGWQNGTYRLTLAADSWVCFNFKIGSAGSSSFNATHLNNVLNSLTVTEVS